MALETPEFQVIKRENPFELRRYAPYLSARITLDAAGHRDAASRGFGTLASYIFGNNIARQKISMTAPVTAAPASEKIAMAAPVTVSGSGRFQVEFSLPSKYTLDTLPQPVDQRVEIIQHEEQTMAVVRFSGVFQQANFDRHIARLRGWIEQNGWTELAPPVVAGYNPPITPWFLKRNEILIAINE